MNNTSIILGVDYSTMTKSGPVPGEYNAVCPKCGKKTFYINIYNKKFICFSSHCKIMGSYIDNNLDFSLEVTYDSMRDRVNRVGSISASNVSIDLEEFSREVDKRRYPMAYAYLESRGFTSHDISKYNIRVGEKYYDEESDSVITRWVGRVIFPYFDSGTPVFALGRSYTGKIPKYMNTYGSKSVVLYNYENVSDECIITEGLISSISAEKYSGIPSVPLLGVTISQFQLYLISRKCKRVYLCLDGGVSTKDMEKALSNLVDEVYVIELPEDKDPDDLKSDFLPFLEKARRVPCTKDLGGLRSVLIS